MNFMLERLMKPEASSQKLLSITRSKAKMFEYDVPLEKHIRILKDPARLFPLAIALLGDLAAKIASSNGREISSELARQLRFAAYFFDSYQGTNLNPAIGNYLQLICAATYYLCDVPGSASVIIRRVNADFDRHGLENLLTWLLSGKFETEISVADNIFAENIDQILKRLPEFYSGAVNFDSLFEAARIIKEKAYVAGTNRDLLIADLIGAVLKKRHLNSCWNSLPMYSNLPVEDWAAYLTKRNPLCELWPAQHLIGKKGLLQGVSAIVQMPTSAGKTRATELIIRSAFLSNRASVAVVIAPFKALCHEIRDGYSRAFGNEDVHIDELTDVLQLDFNLDNLSETRQRKVIIATPEKFLFVLKHVPDLARAINLLIYDEGHQFDNGLRGITYELLLTSLKGLIPENAQTILISAVISNAQQIGDWLSGDKCKVITGFDLSPTYRTVAFSSWLERRGWLEFVSPVDPDAQEFFVPQIIEALELNRLGRERRTINFPTKDDSQSIALYLGIKLVPKGGIAIFCGAKRSVAKICEKLVDAYARGLSLPSPVHFSDDAEVERLTYLCACHLGENSTTTKAASNGVFAHHGNIPSGIRLSIEYAMKESLIKFVICTSTLTQGVNLPIRYLILANLYQGDEQIKVRDFHNLLGRVGRSGMHTEGSIIFADPSLYDLKNGNSRGRWRWGQVKALLSASNSEPCASMLLSIFYPLKSDDKKYTIAFEPMELVSLFIDEPGKLSDLAKDIAEEHNGKGFTVKGLMFQIRQKMDALAAIESYLMSQSSENEQGIADGDLMSLAEGTLAYYLADDGMKSNLKELFKLLGGNLRQRIPDVAKRRVFSRSMYGITSSLEIERWINKNATEIEQCENHEDLLDGLWPLLSAQIHNTSFVGCSDARILKEIAIGWINEQPFYQMLDLLVEQNITFGLGTRRFKAKLDHVMDICEMAFGYEMSLALGAVAETYAMLKPTMTEVTDMISQLQKRVKYGLGSLQAIILYELGFSDRIIAADLGPYLESAASKNDILDLMRGNKLIIKDVLEKYPTYFKIKLRNIIG